MKNPLNFQPRLAGPVRPLTSDEGPAWGRGWQDWDFKGLRDANLQKRLVFQGGQDGQDTHYLGRDCHNLSKMAKFFCGLGEGRWLVVAIQSDDEL